MNEVEAWGEKLVEQMRSIGPAAIALSGGVDSSVVAAAAQRAWGESAIACTGRSASVSIDELQWAESVAQTIGIRHVLIDTDEFQNPQYVANDGTRCYHCKSELYDRIADRLAEWNLSVVCSGANADDLGDYRPGLKAAAERHVRHPLQEIGMSKREIRLLAQHWGLPNWDKPAAPCLSSRIAIGVEATPERTHRVEEAERFLREHGFREFRVRCHAGELARIEASMQDLPRLIEPMFREKLVSVFQSLGFQFVSLDLVGFRSGSLNVMVPAEILTGWTGARHP